jgi:hypothetical protein
MRVKPLKKTGSPGFFSVHCATPPEQLAQLLCIGCGGGGLVRDGLVLAALDALGAFGLTGFTPVAR